MTRSPMRALRKLDARAAPLVDRAYRPIVGFTTGWVAVGLLTAALMSDGAVRSPFAARRPSPFGPPAQTAGGLVAPAPAPPTGAQGGAALASAGSASVIGGPVVAPGAVVSAVSGLAASAPASQARAAGTGSAPSPTPAPRPSPPPAPAPVVSLAAAANAGVTTASASVSIGGGCTGVSIAGSASCAPAAPRSPGVVATAHTPAGAVSV